MKQRIPALGLVLPLLAATGLAQDPKAAPAPTVAQDLKVGMDAPPLKIAKWLKGTAVDAFKPGQIYVVEFWSTSYFPSITVMPHLSKLQRSYKDKGVTIVGVTSGAFKDNTQKAVDDMAASRAEAIDYTLAWDDGAKTTEAYLKAAKQGNPCCFVVDGKGKIAFIGPSLVLEAPLAGVVAGTWDASKDKVDFQATMTKVKDAIDATAKDAAKGRGAVEAATGKTSALTTYADQQLFDKLIKDGAHDRAFALGAQMVDQAIADKDDMTLNHVSWGIVDPKAKIEKRDLDLAMKAAVKAVELTKEKDANILDTLARVWFWKGDIQKAFELQKKAVAIDRNHPEIRDSLNEYEKLVDKAKADKAKADKAKTDAPPAAEGKKGDK